MLSKWTFPSSVWEALPTKPRISPREEVIQDTEGKIATLREDYELLATNGETMLVKKWQEWTADPKQVKKIAESGGLWVAEIQSLVSMAEKTQSLRDSEWRDILRVEPISNISQLVNDGNKIPAVNIYKPLTPDNYTQVVEELFDTTDIDGWLSNPDGSELTKEQKDKYIATMTYEKKKYLKKLNEFRSEFWNEAIKMFLSLYNKWAIKLSHQGREYLRRLFVAAFSITFFRYTNDNMRTLAAWNTATQAWEYIILISNWRVTLAKVQIQKDTKTSLKYILPPDKELKDAWIDGMTWLSLIVLKDLTINYENLYQAALARQEKDTARQRAAEADKWIDTARQEKDTARQEKDTAIKIQELGKKARTLSTRIEELVNKYINNPNNSLRIEINDLISELMEVRRQAKTQLNERDNKEILGLVSSIEEKFIKNFLQIQKF